MDMSSIPRDWLFPPSLEKAAEVQKILAERVIREDDLPPLRKIQRVAGTDVSNNLRDPENIIYAAFTLLSFPELKVIEDTCVKGPSAFPYVPGFLGFREAPALVEAFSQLAASPDVIMVDGHGVSHPRGLGIASHIGVLLDRPAIGVAKSILVGKPEREPGNTPGDHVPLLWKGRRLGAVLRTKTNVQPVYVSTGHKVSLESAIEIVMACATRYRLPEPTRQAHNAANVCRKAAPAPVVEEVQLTFHQQ